MFDVIPIGRLADGVAVSPVVAIYFITYRRWS